MGPAAEEAYTLLEREKPFRVFSQGLGRRYCDDNADRLYDNLYCVDDAGHRAGLLKYYKRRLGITADRLERIALDKDREQVRRVTGEYITSDEMYKRGDTRYERERIKARKQNNPNIIARNTLHDVDKI